MCVKGIRLMFCVREITLVPSQNPLLTLEGTLPNECSIRLIIFFFFLVFLDTLILFIIFFFLARFLGWIYLFWKPFYNSPPIYFVCISYIFSRGSSYLFLANKNEIASHNKYINLILRKRKWRPHITFFSLLFILFIIWFFIFSMVIHYGWLVGFTACKPCLNYSMSI